MNEQGYGYFFFRYVCIIYLWKTGGFFFLFHWQENVAKAYCQNMQVTYAEPRSLFVFLPVILFIQSISLTFLYFYLCCIFLPRSNSYSVTALTISDNLFSFCKFQSSLFLRAQFNLTDSLFSFYKPFTVAMDLYVPSHLSIRSDIIHSSHFTYLPLLFL